MSARLVLLLVLTLMFPAALPMAAQVVGPVAESAAEAATTDGPEMFPSGVGADLGSSPTTLGVRPRAGVNPDGLQTGTRDDRTYWKTNVAADTTYFLFEIDDEYLAGLTSDDLAVSLTFFDEGSGALALSEVREAGSTARADIAFTDTGAWRTHTVALADTQLTGLVGFRLELAEDTPERDFHVSAVRVGSVGARVDLGAQPDAAGITPRAGDNPAGLVTGVQDGRGFWQTNAAAPPPATTYFYMNVADTYVYDTRNVVLVSVDYFDAGNGEFRLQYDSPGDETSDMFKNSEVVGYGDTGTWKTYTFTLEDAVMTNRSNGSDFRLSTDGAPDLKVGSIRVATVAADLDPTEGLRNLIADAQRVHRAAREGDRDGQYPEGSKSTLAQAIGDAEAVAGRPDATETEINVGASYSVRGPAGFPGRCCRHEPRAGHRRIGEQQRRWRPRRPGGGRRRRHRVDEHSGD